MMTRLFTRQRGMALIAVLALMALAVPLIVAALRLAGTLAHDSRVKTGILMSDYAAIGGNQHSIYRLVYDPDYVDRLVPGVEDSYEIVLNGETVTVTNLKISDPMREPPPPKSDNSRRLQALKSVVPATAQPNTPTTFTYTITVENRDDEPEQINKVYDGLPPGFSYVPGSTRGFTTKAPTISGQRLTWDVASLHITIQPAESVELIFDAVATLPEGNYCNEAWVDPGGNKTSSGLTAKVQVGSPATTLCAGEAARLTKTVTPQVAPAGVLTTFTYTITIENTGTEVLNMSKIRDILPFGFTYVAGSTQGDITTSNPNTAMSQDRQRLDWNLSLDAQIQAGQVRALTFRAQAQVSPNKYWNEVWVTLDEFPYTLYTWPTAVVEVMGVFQNEATDGRSTAISEVWIGSDSYVVSSWDLNR